MVHAERPRFAVRVLALIVSDLSNNTGFCWTHCLKEMVVLRTDFPVTFGGTDPISTKYFGPGKIWACGVPLGLFSVLREEPMPEPVRHA